MIAGASRIVTAATAAFALTLILPAHSAAPPRDEVISIDGQNYHLEISGHAGPAVVFEAGLGNDLSTWDLVAEPIAKFARVVRYERPGLGKSLPMLSHDPVTAGQVAGNLRKLLNAAKIRPPYILVGHSLGGL
jgi:pimeloyl-ACP methyl ester carboxylesterase